MRRLTAFLMIAALVAVLVPSAALAGKPSPPKVDGVVVQGSMDAGTPCVLSIQVTYSGRAQWVYISNGTNIPGGRWAVPLDKSGAIVTSDSIPLTFLNGDVTWSLYLTDRKLKPVSPTQTVTEWWGELTAADACPAHGVEIARWPGL